MFGDEYSITTFLPATDEFVPYSGLPDGASYVSLCTCVSTARISDGVLSIMCKNALSCVIDSTKSSAWNYATVPSKKNERRAFIVIIISKTVESNVCCTHLVDDCLCEHVDFTRQTETGEGDSKIDALLAIIDTLVDLFDSQRRQSIRDTLRDCHFERIQHCARGIRSRYIWERRQFK